MATWAGAIIETRGRADFPALAATHRLTVTGAVTPWVLVRSDVHSTALGPPAFAEALSRELQGTVLAFFIQTTASVERLEHWEKGQLVRKLEYAGDAGGWITQQGTPQAWESVYFFADDEGTAEDMAWPVNLGDELSDEQLARYEHARAAKDASGIMDLLRGGSLWQVHRVCEHFGLDPNQPGAHYRPPLNWKPLLLAVAFLAFVVGMVLLSVLSHR
ncbi:MAG TPA: hypothetical protein VEZ71_31420 [Archangium sp.]|nr:hypothetical protein [Archangium sp.]